MSYRNLRRSPFTHIVLRFRCSFSIHHRFESLSLYNLFQIVFGLVIDQKKHEVLHQKFLKSYVSNININIILSLYDSIKRYKQYILLGSIHSGRSIGLEKKHFTLSRDDESYCPGISPLLLNDKTTSSYLTVHFVYETNQVV